MIRQICCFLLLINVLSVCVGASTLACPDEVRITGEEFEGANDYYALINLLENCPQWIDSLAFLQHKLGVHFYFEDQLDSAIYHTHKAIMIRQEIAQGKPNKAVGQSSYNLGMFYSTQGFPARAVEAYEVTASNYRALPDMSWALISTYVQLSQEYSRVGQFQKAATILDLAIVESKALDDPESLADIYLTKGDLLLKQHLFAEAIPELEKADEIYQQFAVSENLASIQLNLAIAFDELDQNDIAETYYQNAVELYNKLGDCPLLTKTYNNLVVFYVEQKDWSKAEYFIEAAKKQVAICQIPFEQAQAYNHQGEFWLAQGKFQQALQSFQQAQEVYLPDFKPTKLHHSSSIEDLKLSANQPALLVYLNDQAKAFSEWYNVEKNIEHVEHALAIYKKGDALIDFMRADHTNPETKLFWRQRVLPFYEQAIQCCYLSGDVEQAFYFFEKSKAILLLEALVTSDALTAISPSLQGQEQALQLQIKTAKTTAETATAEAKQKALESLLDKEQKLKNFYEELTLHYPQFRALQQKDVLSLKSFQERHLHPGRVLVHFFWGEEQVYALVVKNENAKIVALADSKTLQDQVEHFLKYFQSSEEITNAPEQYLLLANTLYHKLLGSYLEQIPQQLLLIPDGPLAYLPFEALSLAAGMHLASADYLVQHTELTYAHSANLFQELCEHQNDLLNGKILGLAPFADKGNQQFSRLLYSGEELATIKKQFDADNLLNEAATRMAFLSDQAKYPLLHLSTHAVGNAEDGEPFIAMADSMLFLSDIYQLEIPAELVILSACQTNTGELARGEGVLGLGRGFIYAGAGSIIASLWNLNDRFTSQIFGSFYQHLADGESKATALRQAKIAFLNDPEIPAFQKSPYFWAGLTYYGNDNKMQIGSSSSKKIWLVVVAGVLGLLLLFRANASKLFSKFVK